MTDAQFWIQIVSTVLIAFTFLVYVFQLRAMRSASTAQNVLAVLNYLQEPHVRESRRLLFANLAEKPIDLWDEEDKKIASVVYGTYDLAGMLIRRDLVPKDLFISNWGASIVRCCKTLDPFLKELRADAPGTKYGIHMQWLRDEVLRNEKSGGV
ncbi:MAG: hypothetical protein HGB26_07645 [Desulfobulbaceae bacterium]|nr:hypothetical protein [Desulfobulbaceae bacterium]